MAGGLAPGLRSGGRSCIVDPWGVVLAQAPDDAAQLAAAMIARADAALQDFAPVFGYPPGADVAGTALPDLDFIALAAGHPSSAIPIA